jgi:hypothetical protein
MILPDPGEPLRNWSGTYSCRALTIHQRHDPAEEFRNPFLVHTIGR